MTELPTDHPGVSLLAALLGLPINDDERKDLAIALRDWIESPTPISFEQALRWRQTAPGQRSLNTRYRLAQRDVLIRALAAAHYSGKPMAVAAAMRKNWSIYAASGWAVDRKLNQVPEHRVGKPEAWYWQIMKLQDQVPSERTIRRTLATS